MAFNRPCLKCGTLTRNQAGYCDRHPPTRHGAPELKAKKKFLYGGTYKQRAKIVRENSTHCHICKEPFTGGDRVEADHMYPELGHTSPLLPAHRKCNQSRGNKPLT